MRKRLRPIPVGYGIAIVATAVVAAFRLMLSDLLGDVAPFMPFVMSVSVTAWYSGLRPGLFATILGAAASVYLFTPPDFTFHIENPGELAGLILFLLIGCTISWLCHALHTAKDQADAFQTAFVSNMGEGLFAVDAHGFVTYMNAAAESMFGWTFDELKGRRMHDMTHHHRPDGSVFPIEECPGFQVLHRGKLLRDYEDAFIRKDGSFFPVSYSSSPLRVDGKIVGLVVVFRDITDRKRKDTEVRHRERLFRALVNASSQSVWHFQLGGDPDEANAAWWREFTGQTEAQRTAKDGMGWLDAVHSEDREVARRNWENILSADRSTAAEYRVQRHDGEWRRLNVRGMPIPDENRVTTEWAGTIVDVTEQRAAEAAIATQHERRRLLSEAAEVLLHAGEPDAMLHSLFAKIAPHFGLDAYFNFMADDNCDVLRLVSCAGVSDGAARNLAKLEFGEGICGAVALRRQPIHAAQIQESDEPNVQLVKSFGIRAYVCNPLMAGDTLLGTLSFASRSRDRFGAEELDFLQTISHYVTVAYERLRMIQVLQDADRRKDEFLATLAHELRNPLAPVRNAVQILNSKGPDASDLQWARDVIDRQMRHMARIMDDLLDVSRISRGKFELKRERLDLANVMRGAVEASRPLIEQCGHELTVALPSQPIYLHADVVRLAQVFSNLLNNAAKYTDQGGHIHLRAERIGSDAVISVEDDGIGIASDKLRNIFEMFSQVHSALERSQGGLGVGLSLARSLVEMHGGHIEARSDGHGKGSEFIVRLPTIIERPSVPAGRDKQATILCSSLRVLVVDDNRDNAQTLGVMLRMMGNEIVTAYDGEEAVRVADDFRPDVVLLDIGLPKINGYDACRFIREKPWGKKMAVIAVTGWGQEEDIRRSQEAGFDRHLVKPLDPQGLMKILVDLTALKDAGKIPAQATP